MGLADDLYDIGLKLDQLKALRAEKEFGVQNRENNIGIYFELNIDGFRVVHSSASDCVDTLEGIRLQYVAEDAE